MSCRTHYEAIGVKEDASQEEIRKTYRSAILALHPDKLLDSSEQSNPHGSEFLEVQRAWKVLGDPGSRALYDRDLRTLRQEAVAAEDISLGDIMVVEEDEDGGVVISSVLVLVNWMKWGIGFRENEVRFRCIRLRLYQHRLFFRVGRAL